MVINKCTNLRERNSFFRHGRCDCIIIIVLMQNIHMDQKIIKGNNIPYYYRERIKDIRTDTDIHLIILAYGPHDHT